MVERSLKWCNGNIVYSSDSERINLPVSLAMQESIAMAAWILPLKVDDEMVKKLVNLVRFLVTKIFYPVTRGYFYPIYKGKNLIHFYNLKKTVPPYKFIENFKFQRRMQGQIDLTGTEDREIRQESVTVPNTSTGNP